MTEQKYCKRLIEVDLPIKRISEFASKEKSTYRGTISSLHTWWARRPLAACRAVILSSILYDPADINSPQIYVKEISTLLKQFRDLRGGQQRNWNVALEVREALLDFVANFSNPINADNPDFIDISHKLVKISVAAGDNRDVHLPIVLDPFAGGGAIPLEALRIGADAFASDLNPVAVLINKVLIEIAPRFKNELEEEIKHWGDWVSNCVKKEISSFYPAENDSDDVPIAYIWARTAKCEGPKCGVTIPLISKMWLSQNGNRTVALKFTKNVREKRVEFEIIERPKHNEVPDGTVKRGAAVCPFCNYVTPASSIRNQFKGRNGGRGDSQFVAVVSTKKNVTGRFFRIPNKKDFTAIESAKKALKELQQKNNQIVPFESLPYLRSIFNIHLLDVKTWGDLFTDRQALAICSLVNAVKNISNEAQKAGCSKELSTAIQTILSFAVDRCAENHTTLCRWNPHGPKLQGTFGRQALPIIWDFCETQPFSGSVGDWGSIIENIIIALRTARCAGKGGTVVMQSATEQCLPDDSAHIVVTDPPYYDLIPYADLSDFFYVWLKRSVGDLYPDLFGDELTPKRKETVQLAERNPIYSYKTKENYENLMKKAMQECNRILCPEGVGVIFFAHKGTSAWESQLSAMIDAGWMITASWPIDTEMGTRLRAMDSATLASSIELVCRPREKVVNVNSVNKIGDWRDVLQALPKKIHEWMPRLAGEGVVGADAIFACLGPALEIFSTYSHVEKANGEKVALGEYLEQVWAVVAKEALNMIFEGAHTEGFEEDARVTAMWLWTLSTSSNNSESGQSNEESEILDAEDVISGVKVSGFGLEYDAARKISQGLGAHLDNLSSIIQIAGDQAKLLPVEERVELLFGKDSSSASHKKGKKESQLNLFEKLGESEDTNWSLGDEKSTVGKTVLDRLHQAMILFGAGRSEALKRFLTEEGIGRDERFWRLAQALSALYPSATDEKRWVDGVLARKKSLGF